MTGSQNFLAGAELDEVDIFLSYNHADDLEDGRASALHDRLTAAGYAVWYDKNISGGENWQTAIQVNLRRCRLIVALWSKRSVASDWCKVEAINAAAESKLFPVLMEPLAREDFSDAMHDATVAIQRVAYDAPDLMEQLAARVSASRAEAERKRQASARAILASKKAHLPEVLASGQPDLFGRDVEESMLLDAWASCAPDADPARKTNLVVLYAIGGAGKTALLRRLVDDLAANDFAHAEKVIGWSAYSQGSGDNRNADAGTFISSALDMMGFGGDKPSDEVARARLLASLMQKRRTLLLLDGIEPLQSPPHVNLGRLKDKGLAALLIELARDNPGLVVVTSRQPLPETEKIARVRNHSLAELKPSAGAALLKRLGCWGAPKDLEAASDEADGHALTLTALGGYIEAVEAGDIRKRDHFKLGEITYTAEEMAAPDPTVRAAKKAAAVMAGYVAAFEALEKKSKGEGVAERVLLHIVGLFDRPADGAAVKALLDGEPIAEFTDAMAGWTPHQKAGRIAAAKKRLRTLKLLHEADPEDKDGLDAHPIVRAHFANALKAAAPEAFRAAHERLYRMYATVGLPKAFQTPIGFGLVVLSTMVDADRFPMFVSALSDGSFPAEAKAQLPEGLSAATPAEFSAFLSGQNRLAFDDALQAFLPDTLDEMTPLFHAIGHACAARLHQEVWGEVYYGRVRCRDKHFIVDQLGAFGADLGALAHFFDAPWGGVSSNLTPPARSAALNFAASALRALGRLAEAEQAESAGLSMDVAAADWKNAAKGAGNVSELRLALGNVAGAIDAARQAVAFADRAGDGFGMMAMRTTHADALLQAGRLGEAAALFVDAEARQVGRQPDLPRLYSLQGYQFCDLLLECGRAAEVRERAGWIGDLYNKLGEQVVLLDRGLVLLADGRTLAVLTAHGQADGAQARARLDAAVEALRRAGNDDDLPRGLLARARHLCRIGEIAAAAKDIDDALDIAERGGMKLHLADCALETARLALAQIAAAPPETLVPLVETVEVAPARTPGAIGRLFGAKPSPAIFEDRVVSPPPAPWTPRTEPLSDAERRHLADAEAHYARAFELVQKTGYHRRDGELADLRARLDALSAL